jgi:hypothetical protein
MTEDWPIAEIRRSTTPVQPAEIPTECPSCHSQRIFLGSGNIRCYHCNAVTKISKTIITMSDTAEAAKEAQEEQQQLVRDFRKNRGEPQ